jgi:hypothetical protein
MPLLLLLALLSALSTLPARALDLVASPLLINEGGTFGVTWNGAPAKDGDWIGLYSAGAPDSSPWVWVRYTWTLPAVVPPGAAYEFRLFCCYSFARLGVSNQVWVQDPSNPQPQPQQPQLPAAYDYSDTTWQPGPIIGGRNWSSPGSPEYDGVTFHVGGNVDYVTTQAAGPLPYGGKIRFRFRLHGGPLYGMVEPIASSGVFLHFQRAGDTWTGQGAYNCFRLWSHQDVSLSGKVGGDYEVEVPLTEQHWGGVFAGCSQAEFMAALSQVDKLGWTHLDAESKGHGNQAFAAGTRIEVLEYRVLNP